MLDNRELDPEQLQALTLRVCRNERLNAMETYRLVEHIAYLGDRLRQLGKENAELRQGS